MARSNKAVVTQREQEVYRLLLAGAEFAEIRQFASDRSWHVSDRQIRRYMEVAYKRLAKLASRDRQQLLGRHLMQRLAIYARHQGRRLADGACKRCVTKRNLNGCMRLRRKWSPTRWASESSRESSPRGLSWKRKHQPWFGFGRNISHPVSFVERDLPSAWL